VQPDAVLATEGADPGQIVEGIRRGGAHRGAHEAGLAARPEIALDRRGEGAQVHRKGIVDVDQPELLPPDPGDHHRLLDRGVRLVEEVGGELFAHPARCSSRSPLARGEERTEARARGES
jgi:hypothetical protein